MAVWIGKIGLFNVILEVLVYFAVGIAVVSEVTGATYISVVV